MSPSQSRMNLFNISIFIYRNLARFNECQTNSLNSGIKCSVKKFDSIYGQRVVLFHAICKTSLNKIQAFCVLVLSQLVIVICESKSRPDYLKRHVAYIASNPSYLVFRRGAATASNTKQHPVCLSLSLFSPPLHLIVFDLYAL